MAITASTIHRIRGMNLFNHDKAGHQIKSVSIEIRGIFLASTGISALQLSRIDYGWGAERYRKCPSITVLLIVYCLSFFSISDLIRALTRWLKPDHSHDIRKDFLSSFSILPIGNVATINGVLGGLFAIQK